VQPIDPIGALSMSDPGGGVDPMIRSVWPCEKISRTLCSDASPVIA
jgi:hypothetical protein